MDESQVCVFVALVMAAATFVVVTCCLVVSHVFERFGPMDEGPDG